MNEQRNASSCCCDSQSEWMQTHLLDVWSHFASMQGKQNKKNGGFSKFQLHWWVKVTLNLKIKNGEKRLFLWQLLSTQPEHDHHTDASTANGSVLSDTVNKLTRNSENASQRFIQVHLLGNFKKKKHLSFIYFSSFVTTHNFYMMNKNTNGGVCLFFLN